jgi:UDP-GlcNAc:undecaprenyl-phosphate GlcNAc-1-phosphate transferase
MTLTTTTVLILLTALTGTLLATPVVRRLALRFGVVDTPSARKIHLQPIPLLGGVAIYLGFILALVFLGSFESIREMIAILVGASLISLMGIWDDRWGLRPLIKLLGQVIAAVVLLLAGIQVGIFPMEWESLNIIITVLWVAGITNALNLLDNMDGLSGGVAAVAAGFFLLLAASSGQYLVSALAAALLGACLGFLRYNLNPASIFMGDAGSLFLGFTLAALGIKLRFPASQHFPQNADLITWMIPILVLGIPIFDTTLVFISRLRRRLNPLTNPGKDHLSHRLVALGMSRREAVLTIYVLAFGLGMVAVLLSTLLRTGATIVSLAEIITGYGIGGAVLLGAILALVYLERGWKPPQPAEPDAVEKGSTGPSGP